MVEAWHRVCGHVVVGMWSCAHVVFDGGDSAWSPRRCRARGSRGPSAQSDRCVIWGTSGAHLGRPPRSAPPRRREYAPAPKAEKQWSPAAYPLGQLPTPAASARCALTFSRPCVPSSPSLRRALGLALVRRRSKVRIDRGGRAGQRRYGVAAACSRHVSIRGGQIARARIPTELRRPPLRVYTSSGVHLSKYIYVRTYGITRE